MKFLNKLQELLEIEDLGMFSCMCRKQQPNVTSYLNGNKKPGKDVLTDCLFNAVISRIFESRPDNSTNLGKKADKIRDEVLKSLFDQEVIARQEVQPIPKKQSDFPEFGGVYILYDSAVNVLYIGKATNFRNEIWQTLNRVKVGMRFGSDMKKFQRNIEDLAQYMSLYEISNKSLRHNIEALLIRVFINQTHNKNVGKFKK